MGPLGTVSAPGEEGCSWQGWRVLAATEPGLRRLRTVPWAHRQSNEPCPLRLLIVIHSFLVWHQLPLLPSPQDRKHGRGSHTISADHSLISCCLGPRFPYSYHQAVPQCCPCRRSSSIATQQCTQERHALQSARCQHQSPGAQLCPLAALVVHTTNQVRVHTGALDSALPPLSPSSSCRTQALGRGRLTQLRGRACLYLQKEL